MEFKPAEINAKTLVEKITQYVPNPRYRHDEFSKVAVAEAIEAAKEGNIGVGGTVIYKGKPLFRDHNRQFIPFFVVSETKLVNNLRDYTTAFEKHWPEGRAACTGFRDLRGGAVGGFGNRPGDGRLSFRQSGLALLVPARKME